MTTFSGRLDRLERHRAPDPGDPFGLDNATDEQLTIMLLDICRAELDDPDIPAAERARVETEISEIEDRIRKTAKVWADPRYEAHRQRVLGMWDGARGAVGEYVPEVIACGFWWQWDRPKLIAAKMRWRAEIRQRSDIAALIAEGEAWLQTSCGRPKRNERRGPSSEAENRINIGPQLLNPHTAIARCGEAYAARIMEGLSAALAGVLSGLSAAGFVPYQGSPPAPGVGAGPCAEPRA
jgi:hypothetical protein